MDVGSIFMKHQKYVLSYFFLALAIIGALFPMLANIEFMQLYGPNFNIELFIQLANNNSASRSISRDLLISSTSILVWIYFESKRINMKNIWIVYFGTFIISFAFAAPLFLFLRERRLIEINE